MKILSAKEMARIEQLAYADGCKEEDFMQGAGEAVADCIRKFIAKRHIDPKIILLLGSGNNAADALVAGGLLRSGGFDVVALALSPFEKCSPLYQIHAKHFEKVGGKIYLLEDNAEINFSEATLLIDGIFGTGFHGEVGGIHKRVIERANASDIPIISVDIPSGVNGTTAERAETSICATATCFLGFPKTGCFLGEVWNLVGEIYCYDFGLPESFKEQAQEDFLLIDEHIIKEIFPKIVRTRHKYEAGYVVGVGGSPGMPGAPILASYAALRAGAGIVRLLYPKGMEAELAAAPYEMIREGYEDCQTIFEAAKKAAALFLGPGMGTTEKSYKILKELTSKIKTPCVIDADALSLMGSYDLGPPAHAILTPHIGEMKRLLKVEEELSIKELLFLTQKYSIQHDVTIVLKGALTYIFHPEKQIYISAKGDPGMATAGSGDVLTGVIAAFLAQTKNPLHAAILGAHTHAVAGEMAAKTYGSYSMIASDIIENLYVSYTNLQK